MKLNRFLLVIMEIGSCLCLASPILISCGDNANYYGSISDYSPPPRVFVEEDDAESFVLDLSVGEKYYDFPDSIKSACSWRLISDHYCILQAKEPERRDEGFYFEIGFCSDHETVFYLWSEESEKVFYEPSVCSQSIWTEGFEELIGWNKINGTYDENYDYYGYYSDGYYYGDGSNGEISEDKTAPVITITSGVMPDQTVILDRIQAEIIVSANENIERFNCLGSGVTCLLSDEKKLIIFIDSTENNPAGIEVLVFDAAGNKSNILAGSWVRY